MRTHALIAATLGLSLALPVAAQEADERPTPNSVVEGATVDEWEAISANDLMVMRLADDAEGNRREVVIQLMPKPFSQGWVDNIRLLAETNFWDGTTVYRVVDNWVTQWGDGEDDKAKAKPLPEGIKVVPESEYVVGDQPEDDYCGYHVCPANRKIKLSEFRTIEPYGTGAISKGWPVAVSGNQVWPTHCYASVGVARDLTPNTGTGAELYTVIGHAPRQLDRNIAVVGRVIEGIEHLSTLPRGKGGAGVYADDMERVPVQWVRMAGDLSEDARPKFEYLATDSASFAEYVRVRANRSDGFYQVAAGGVDICNVQVPIRRIKAAE